MAFNTSSKDPRNTLALMALGLIFATATVLAAFPVAHLGWLSW